jgi:hypothetical protein
LRLFYTTILLYFFAKNNYLYEIYTNNIPYFSCDLKKKHQKEIPIFLFFLYSKIYFINLLLLIKNIYLFLIS